MANDRKDPNEYSTLNEDVQRDNAAKDQSTTPLGKADYDRDISGSYDTQTQLAAKSTENKNDKNKINKNENHNTSGM